MHRAAMSGTAVRGCMDFDPPINKRYDDFTLNMPVHDFANVTRTAGASALRMAAWADLRNPGIHKMRFAASASSG